MAEQNFAMHEAEAYLRDTSNPATFHVSIGGRRSRLFINRDEGVIGIVAIGKRKRGYVFHDWNSIEKVYIPTVDGKVEEERMLFIHPMPTMQ